MKIKFIISTLLLVGSFFSSASLHSMSIRSLDEVVSPFHTEPSYQYKIIPAPGNTWGYDILKDNKIFIHQPNRPGLQGMGGFSSKKDAIKVAELVIAKIKKGEMPPTISPEELGALKLAN